MANGAVFIALHVLFAAHGNRYLFGVLGLVRRAIRLEVLRLFPGFIFVPVAFLAGTGSLNIGFGGHLAGRTRERCERRDEDRE